MVLKRGTLLLLLSAIALGGGVLLFENRSTSRSPETANGETEAVSEKLFPFEEEAVEQFSVTRQKRDDEPEEPDTEDLDAEDTTEEDTTADGADVEEPAPEEPEPEEPEPEKGVEETLSFVKSEDGTWQMTAPETARAEGGAIAFLLSQVATPAAVPVAVDTENLAEFGLAEPEATVSLVANGQDYLLHVGGLDFLGDKRYVQVMEVSSSAADPADEQAGAAPDETLKIYAISGSIINAVDRPTADWLVIEDTAVEDPVEESDSAEQGSEVDSPNADVKPDISLPEAPEPEKPESAAPE